MVEILVPIALFTAIAASIVAVSRYRHKSHTNASEVMKTIAEKGEPLTPDIIQSLGIRPSKPHGDLRIGSVLVAFALATILFGRIIPEDEATLVMGGLAMFPLFVGIAFIGLWFFISRKPPRG